MDESRVLALIDELAAIMQEAKPVMFGDRSCSQVNVDVVLEILDEMRGVFPEEITQARAIVAQRQNLLDDAQAEADRLIQDAQMQVKTIASETEVVRVSYLQADQLKNEAREYERETRQGAEDYAMGVFDYLVRDLENLMQNVNRTRDRMNSNFNNQR